MIGTLDSTMMEHENQRIGSVLALLYPFTRHRTRSDARHQRPDPIGRSEIDLADASVAEFRCRCSWE